MQDHKPSIRWLEREVFKTNPALDQRRLRALLTSRGARRASVRLSNSGRARSTATNGNNGSTAQVLLDLLGARRVAGSLPKGLRAAFDDGWNRALARLVLDDVLRVRTRTGFVGGAGAYSRVFLPGHRENGLVHSAARLSFDVLESVARIPSTDGRELALHLYDGHRQPVTPAWHRRFPSPAATRDALVADLGAPYKALLERHWRFGRMPRGPDDWLIWSARRLPPLRATTGVSYKLYISPALPVVKEAFRRCVSIFADQGVAQFKIGSGAYALCRPDKFVAYFATRDELDETSRAMCTALGDLEAHGVPFCAPVDERGLLWWGIDFHEGLAPKARDEQTSWRMWVCKRLALSLVRAKQESSLRVAPWRFALDRLALDGVNPQTFAPTSDFLHDAAFAPNEVT